MSPLGELARRLAQAGFDVVHPFRVAQLPAELVTALALDHEVGVVVGNTRALWPVFSARLARDATLAALPDPLDAYTEEQIHAALGGLTATSVFAHRPPFAPVQRVAAASGLASLGPAGLVAHPVHGPWIALRAVVGLDVDPSELGPTRPASEPCAGCAAPCKPAFEHALARSPATRAGVREHAALWIAVRDACPVGKDARYGDEQLAYHHSR